MMCGGKVTEDKEEWIENIYEVLSKRAEGTEAQEKEKEENAAANG